MNELTKIKQRILERIETYIGDIEFTEEQELTEDEKTIFESVKNIINEEFDRVTPSNTEHIIKTTIKEYLDKDCDDNVELLLSLSKDLCERIKHEDEKTIFESIKHIINVEEKMGKPVWSHELYTLKDEIKEKSKADFIELCRTARDTEKEKYLDVIDEEINKLQPPYKHIAAMELLVNLKEKIKAL